MDRWSCQTTVLHGFVNPPLVLRCEIVFERSTDEICVWTIYPRTSAQWLSQAPTICHGWARFPPFHWSSTTQLRVYSLRLIHLFGHFVLTKLWKLYSLWHVEVDKVGRLVRKDYFLGKLLAHQPTAKAWSRPSVVRSFLCVRNQSQWKLVAQLPFGAAYISWVCDGQRPSVCWWGCWWFARQEAVHLNDGDTYFSMPQGRVTLLVFAVEDP